MLLLLLLMLLAAGEAAAAAGLPSLPIGVNYGANADNLPPPTSVAAFLATKTTINRVKLFDANPTFISAFANTPVTLAVSLPNSALPALADRATGLDAARSWIRANLSPYVPATNVTLLLAGNEILLSTDKSLILSLVPAMRCLAQALKAEGLTGVRVTTPHFLGILAPSDGIPSNATFRAGYNTKLFPPMLQFHRDTGSPFMVNPYPYFSYRPETLNYALFRPNAGIYDPATKLNYTSMFEAQMDAIYTAMKKLGFGDVEIAVGEAGWPTQAEPGQIGGLPASSDYPARTNPFDSDSDSEVPSRPSRAQSAPTHRTNQSVQELEDYAVHKAEATSCKVNDCVRAAEAIRQDATQILLTLHRQGEQITRTHRVASNIDQDLSMSEKLLGSLGGLFSRTWRPMRNQQIKGPISQNNPFKSTENHMEQGNKLRIASSPQQSPSTVHNSPATAMRKVQAEKAKQDDALSDLSNSLEQLRDMSLDMGTEIERQNRSLDTCSEDVDDLNLRIKRANQWGRRLLGK